MIPKQLTILGVGLLGGSIGLALRSISKECRIIGYGHRRSTLDAALDCGAIDAGTQSAAEAVAGSDLVILCTPVGLFRELLIEIAPALQRGAVLTDVGSTKQSVVRAAGEILQPSVRFVGSHPMAGSEKRGVEFARADLFRNALCIVTPTPADLHDRMTAIEHVEQFWTLLGMRITRLDAAVHDRLLADVSHLPHALAAALVAMQADDGLALCGKGFIDATRIAGGDGGLWRDILLDNADNVRQSLAALRRQLDRLDEMLAMRHADTLRGWLDTAAARRNKLMEQKIREMNPD